MTLRNLSAIVCVALASCSSNPVRNAYQNYNEYTVQVCTRGIGSIDGEQVGKSSIATLFILPVGSTVDGYRVYQTDILNTKSDPLHWVVIEVQSKGQKRYFSFSSGHSSPRQVEWSAWRPADFWTQDNPSMSYVHGGKAFMPSAPGAGSPVLRYRILKNHQPNWIVERRLHGETTRLPSCNEK